MTQQELIKQLEDTCLGLDPVDPLRLLVDDVIEALTQPELCKYGQEPKSCTSSPMDCQCAIDAAFAQPEQEPVGYWKEHAQGLQRDYDSLLADFQAQRSESSGKPSAWVGLTDEEILDNCESVPEYDISNHDLIQFARAIEAKLREKNSQHKEKNT